MARAVNSGSMMRGTTLVAMRVTDSMKLMSASVPISVNSIGASTATETLETIENVATRATLPPSIPVMTGAAVAVGQKMQMKVPSASSRLNGSSAR